jgi:hypothetical protein
VKRIEACVAIGKGIVDAWIEEHDVTNADPAAPDPMVVVARQMLAARQAPKRP